MAAQQPVNPQYGSGQTLTSGASADVAVPPTKQLVLTNYGAYVFYVRCGAAAQTATAADFPVPPGCQVTITKDADHLHMAHYAPTATTGHVMGGEGF
jgi:hypothetical protein